MKDRNDIRWDLIILYIQDDLPEEKLEEWNEFLRICPEYKEYVESMKSLRHQVPLIEGFSEEELRVKYKQLSARVAHRHSRKMVYISYAASIVILFFVSFFYFNREGKEAFDKQSAMIDRLAHPGGKQAELILSTGEKLDISMTDGMTDTLGGAVLGASGLVYKNNLEGNSQEYNTLRVPRGGEFQLMLADGTLVHLNSESSLTYPVKFSPGERKIRLSGEAFFEVVSNGSSFVVETEQQEVKVLGTKFNVSCYRGEEVVVLESGRVVVDSRKGSSQELRPGEMAVLREGEYQVEPVDTRLYTSWKEGIFYFHYLSLSTIVEQLSRWYDVEIVFSDEDVKKLHFTGAIEKDRPLSFTLALIKATTSVEFEVCDQRIIIKKK